MRRADKPNVVFILVDDMGIGDLSSVNGGLSAGSSMEVLIRFASGLMMIGVDHGAHRCVMPRSCIEKVKIPAHS